MDFLSISRSNADVGSSLGAVFAGDLITLFIYWELTAVTSVFLVWAGRSRRSYGAGMRYLIIQVGSGVVLLAGVILHLSATGSLAFDRLIGADGLLRLASPGVLLMGATYTLPYRCRWVPRRMHRWVPRTHFHTYRAGPQNALGCHAQHSCIVAGRIGNGSIELVDVCSDGGVGPLELETEAEPAAYRT